MREDDPLNQNLPAVAPETVPIVAAKKPTALMTVVAFVGGIVVALLVMTMLNRSSSTTGRPRAEATQTRKASAIDVRSANTDDARSLGFGANATADDPQRGDMQICGMPGIAPLTGVGLADDPRFAARIDATNKRFIDALSVNADERVRAAAWLLERQEALRLAQRSAASAIASVCGADPQCIQVAERQSSHAALVQSTAPAIDALARAATTSTTPAVYAAAIDACTGWMQSGTPAASCALLSPEQWARIDPDNADAWLHVAGAAAARKDAAAVDDAMNHVAHAKGSRLYGDAIASLVDDAIPAGSADFDASQMHVSAWSVLAGWSLPPLQTVTAYCAEPALADNNRRQTCDAVARQLIDNGSSMIERGYGVRLASRLGWPAEVVAGLRQEQDALQRASILGQNRFEDLASCSAVEKLRTSVSQVGRFGEVGAARMALAASGRSVADLAAEVEVERASQSASAPNQPVRSSLAASGASAP